MFTITNLIKTLSWQFYGGLDFLKLIDEYILRDKIGTFRVQYIYGKSILYGVYTRDLWLHISLAPATSGDVKIEKVDFDIFGLGRL